MTSVMHAQGGADKEERSLDEWLAYIAREEAAGDRVAEAELLQVQSTKNLCIDRLIVIALPYLRMARH